MNQLSRSPVTRMTLNSEKFNQLFGVEGYKLDSTNLGAHISWFKEKLGGNKELEIDAHFKNYNVMFGHESGADVYFEYDLCMNFKTRSDGK